MFAVICLAASSVVPYADRQPPKVAIHFPFDGSLTDGATITVTGAARDEHGVVSLSVNGVPATSADGFANWHVSVPLSLGNTLLRVSATDGLGNVALDAAHITVENHGPFALALVGSIFDAASGCVLIGDSLWDGILSIDPETGLRTQVSSLAQGTGPTPSSPTGIAILPGGNELLVSDGFGNSIFRVDRATGDRTLVSGGSLGQGPLIFWPTTVVYDPIFDRAIVPSGLFSKELLSIDLTTGDRAVLSGASVGAGPAFGAPSFIVFDAAHARVVASDAGRQALFAVDPSNGDRTILSDAATGSGPAFGAPRWLALSANGDTAYVCDLTLRALFVVDLATGARTIVSQDGDGKGPDIVNWVGAAFDENAGRVCVADYDELFTIDLATGVRTSVSSDRRGQGSAFGFPGSVALDRDRRRLLVQDASNAGPPTSRVVEVDLSTGDRHSLFDSGVTPYPYWLRFDFDEGSREISTIGGNDTNAAATVGLDVDSLALHVYQSCPTTQGFPLEVARGTAGEFFVGFDQSIGVLDPYHGTRALLTGPGAGSGPLWTYTLGIGVDRAADELLVVSTFPGSGLFAVDLDTGARRIVSDATVGQGYSFYNPTALCVDASARIAYVADYSNLALFAVDLTTGDRTVVTKGGVFQAVDGGTPPNVGTGPFFEYTTGVAIAPELGVAFTTHADLLIGVLAVELGSGDRVLFSR
ncbi:MAG: hypothetical protein K8S98_17510 [Planctomycetes bacterium]|nr:hypothetical protein [Planctomycetota bacterium]